MMPSLPERPTRSKPCLWPAADINEPGGPWNARLHLVGIGGPRGDSQLLIDKHADIEATLATGFRPLHTAVSFGHENVARLLVVRGAATEARDAFGENTSAHRSERRSSRCGYSLDNGAEVNAGRHQQVDATSPGDPQQQNRNDEAAPRLPRGP